MCLFMFGRISPVITTNNCQVITDLKALVMSSSLSSVSHTEIQKKKNDMTVTVNNKTQKPVVVDNYDDGT